MRRSAALVLLFASLVSLSGCSGFRWPFFRNDDLDQAFTEEDLSSEVTSYVTRFSAQVTNASDDIRDSSPDRTIRRRALVWQLNMPPIIEEVAADASPRFAYFACLLISTAQRNYLRDGEGKDLFGDQQQVAIDTATLLLDDILGVGARFLSNRQLREISARAEDLATQFPIQGRDFSVQRIPRTIVRQEATSSLGWFIALPLAPFRALEGVDSGADAIHDFNRTAQQFAQIAARLPERLRGQMQLLLYDIEDRETVQHGTAAMQSVAASADLLAQTAARLPEDLRKALLESQGSVDAVGRVVTQAQTLAGPVADAATQLERASAHWLTILGPNDPTPDPNKRPFDVTEWRDAAQSIGTAATELRGLATEIETLSGSSALDRAVDRAFWRGVALIGVFFAALLAYKVLAARLTRTG
ncbi:MAG: hypothetical protein MUF70_15775 [Myxococcota bacterium]|nr:hypothetical protein [Myxococcota bacterium]